jgi:hypothetical protein
MDMRLGIVTCNIARDWDLDTIIEPCEELEACADVGEQIRATAEMRVSNPARSLLAARHRLDAISPTVTVLPG